MIEYREGPVKRCDALGAGASAAPWEPEAPREPWVGLPSIGVAEFARYFYSPLIPLEEFMPIEGENWDELKARHRQYLIQTEKNYVGRPFVKIAYVLRGKDGDGTDYREDLARFPNDPEAHVRGPRDVDRLIDKRKRQGWTRGPDVDTLGSALERDDYGLPPEPAAEAMVRDALAQAKAEV